jgi:hypothetical protein
MGICKLCERATVLLRKSHIMPKFMFDELYDEKHQLHLFRPADLSNRVEHIGKRPNTAPYDGDILCQTCDNEVLGAYESYAAQVLFGKNLPESTAPEVKSFIDPPTGMSEHHFSKLNYGKLKTFFLSIVWRAHISQHPFFNEVDLGPYEPEFRRSVRTGFGGSEDRFPVYCLEWLRASFPQDLLAKPIKVKWKRRRTAYLLLFRGLIVWVFISPQAEAPELEQYKLRKDGTLKIFGLNDEAARFLMSKVFNVDQRIFGR